MLRIYCLIIAMCCAIVNLYSQNKQSEFLDVFLKDNNISKNVKALIEEYSKGIDSLQQNVYADFILKIEAVKSRLQPSQIEGTNKYKIPNEVIKEYVDHFDCLQSTRQHAIVQCLYKKQTLGGQPYLIMSEQSLDSLDQSEVFSYDWIHKNAASNFMVPCKDTAMAYFQYLVFKMYGEQFALYWHALYNKKEILLLYPKIDIFLQNDFLKYSVVDEKLNKEALEYGTLPVVTMNNEHCRITFFEENHNNIVRKTYLIQRGNPWEINLIEENVIIHKKNSILY